MTLLLFYLVVVCVFVLLFAFDGSVDEVEAPIAIICSLVWPLTLLCLLFIAVRNLK